MEFETWDRDTLIKEIQTEFEVLTQLPGELHYSNEKLLEKDIKDLQNIYFDLKRKTDKNFYPQYEKELDRAYEFNAPEYDADFISWSKHPTWEIDEAVALLLGKDPAKVTWDKLKEDSPNFPLARKFNQLRMTVSRYISSGELVEPITPAEFLAWAEGMKFDIPEELTKTITNFKRPCVNFKEQYEQLTKQYVEALELISQKDEEIKALNLKISTVENHQQQSGRKTLLKMILGMAMHKYEYDPYAKNNIATGSKQNSIHAGLTSVEINVTDETIKRYLNEAKEVLLDIKN